MFRHVLCVVLAFLVTLQTAFAWSASGHHIIAVLAFDQTTPRTQKLLLEILEHHPRIREDFQPDKRPTHVAHKLIGQAAYWPDIARDQPEFNRRSWHYQLGASVIIGDAVNVPETPGPLPPGATLATQELHIAQAIGM
jgi:hypothetical protein